MASAKIVSLAIRTIAKPIATQIKHQAMHHEKFKKVRCFLTQVCISLAQFLHRTEARMRSNLLGGESIKVRPLNDAKVRAGTDLGHCEWRECHLGGVSVRRRGPDHYRRDVPREPQPCAGARPRRRRARGPAQPDPGADPQAPGRGRRCAGATGGPAGAAAGRVRHRQRVPVPRALASDALDAGRSARMAQR